MIRKGSIEYPLHPVRVERAYQSLQRKALDALRKKTSPEELAKMSVEDLGKVLKACRDGLSGVQASKMRGLVDPQIEFVAKVPVEKITDA